MSNDNSVDVEALWELRAELKEVARSKRAACSYFIGELFDCENCPADGNVLGCEKEMLNHIACRIREAIEEREEPEPWQDPWPDPVLAADGLPIVEGETVYGIPNDQKYTINRIVRHENVEVTYAAEATNERDYYVYLTDIERYVTHTPPDTQERIDEDVDKDYVSYWDCMGKTCRRCDVINGESPPKHYGVDGCGRAKWHDLMRRQRELDARLMGGE